MNRSRLTLAALLSAAAFAANAESPLASGQAATAGDQRSRAEVQAEFIANRDRVAAFTREDSGSAFLTATRGTTAVPVPTGRSAAAR